jgi:hypothetical protein
MIWCHRSRRDGCGKPPYVKGGAVASHDVITKRRVGRRHGHRIGVNVGWFLRTALVASSTHSSAEPHHVSLRPRLDVRRIWYTARKMFCADPRCPLG